MNSSSPTELTTRAIIVFAALQVLDVITTLLGWRLARFLNVGPVSGLLTAKLVGLVLIVAVFVRGKVRLVRLLNLWFAGIVLESGHRVDAMVDSSRALRPRSCC